MRSLSFELGEWRVDPDTNEMARGGVVVRIEPKAMDVLVVLARHDGDVVTRDELLATVWAGVIVGDEALSQAVIKLRRALGDDPRAPRYIETIPKRGYRLIAGVSKVHARRSLALRPRAIALAFVVMLAIGALIAWRGLTDPHEAARGMPRSADASLYFVEGQQKLLVRRMTENGEARTLFRKAIEADPAFARAYAGLAMTYALESRLGGKDASLRALQLAETARLIDPDLPDVYWVMGFVQVQSRNHEAAIASLRRAIELDGSFADAYALLGGIYTYVGQPQRSVPLLRTAMRLKPDGGYLYYLLLGRAYLFDNDIEQALINLRAAAMRNPVDVETRAYLAAALSAGGEEASARWEGEEIRALRPDFSARMFLGTYPMTDDAQERRLAALLASAGLQ